MLPSFSSCLCPTRPHWLSSLLKACSFATRVQVEGLATRDVSVHALQHVLDVGIQSKHRVSKHEGVHTDLSQLLHNLAPTQLSLHHMHWE